MLTAATSGGSFRPAPALSTYPPKPTTQASAAAANRGASHARRGAGTTSSVPRVARGPEVSTKRWGSRAVARRCVSTARVLSNRTASPGGNEGAGCAASTAVT